MTTITNLTELKQWTEFVHTSMSAPWSPSKWQMTRHSYNIVIYVIYTIAKRWNITKINLKCLFLQIACFASVKSRH